MQPGCRRLFTRREFEIVRRENSRYGRSHRFASFCNNCLCYRLFRSSNYQPTANAFNLRLSAGLRMKRREKEETRGSEKKKRKKGKRGKVVRRIFVPCAGNINRYQLFSLSFRAIFAECLSPADKINDCYDFCSAIGVFARSSTVRKSVAIGARN